MRQFHLLRDQSLISQASRFVMVGGTNTLVTLILFVAFQLVVSRRVAYTIVFAIGLGVTVTLNSTFVFRRGLALFPVVKFLCWYLAIYGVGILVVSLVGSQVHSAWLIALATAIVVAPLNFLVGRRVFRPADSEIVIPLSANSIAGGPLSPLIEGDQLPNR